MNSVIWAQVAAVTLVLFAGISVYQLTATFEELEEKAFQFAEMAAEGEAGTLKWVRVLAYGLLPVIFIAVLLKGGLPWLVLFGAGLKLFLSVTLSIWLENRILIGEAYSRQRHRMAQLDSLANLMMTVSLVYLLLDHWLH